MKHNVATAVPRCLVHEAPKLWTQKDWNGLEIAGCGVAILDMFGGALPLAWETFRSRISQKYTSHEDGREAAALSLEDCADRDGPSQGPAAAANLHGQSAAARAAQAK